LISPFAAGLGRQHNPHLEQLMLAVRIRCGGRTPGL
jgi:hypothetical protein